MAIIKAVSSHASLRRALNYIMQEKKTNKNLIDSYNMILLDRTPLEAYKNMTIVKRLYHKNGGRTYKHFVHSYPKTDNITPEQALDNAYLLVKTTKAFEGYQVVLATHTDRNHIHTHIIVNSVSMNTGKKLQWSSADLRDLKERCNKLSLIQGLSVPEKGKTIFGTERENLVSYKKDTYNFLKKADNGEVKSYVQDIAVKVTQAKSVAKSIDEFKRILAQNDITVTWAENHKYITFKDEIRANKGEKQCKVRNNKLSQYYNMDFSKGGLLNEFEKNGKRNTRTTDTRTTNDRIATERDSIAAERDRIAIQLDTETKQSIRAEETRNLKPKERTREEEPKLTEPTGRKESTTTNDRITTERDKEEESRHMGLTEQNENTENRKGEHNQLTESRELRERKPEEKIESENQYEDDDYDDEYYEEYTPRL